MTKEKNDSDRDVQRYARLFDTLEAHLPISDAFEEKDPQRDKRWWGSQRQHMGCYFAGRVPRLGDWSAEAAYMALQHAEGIMWMVEALDTDGDHTARLVNLSEEIFAGAEQMARGKRAKFLRHPDHLPWSVIHNLAHHRL